MASTEFIQIARRELPHSEVVEDLPSALQAMIMGEALEQAMKVGAHA
jgi:hypothetical protein